MEEERATVSLEVYEQAQEENKIDSVERSRENMDPVLKELELSATRETESCDLNKEPTRSDEKSNVLMQPVPLACPHVQAHVLLEQLPVSGDIYNGATPSAVQTYVSAITAMPNPVPSVSGQVASADQVCGQEIKPHNKRDTKSLGTPLENAIISSNRFQEVQLPLTQQEPVKF